MSSYPNNSLDGLLLQRLMSRMQLRPPYLDTNSFLSHTLEDFLQETNTLEDEESDLEKTHLSKEESKIEKEIIRIIHTGNTETLKPNSGQAVTICEHHICVGFHEEKESDYRVWEWHGHVMLFDEENGYNPEYIYGNYFERLQVKIGGNSEEDEDEEEKGKEIGGGNLGLRELIGDGDSVNGRIVHRNLNVGSPC
ncbi:uncharacterized protein LOC143884900 [Tasmannia lanceolata]|uniref:uncharacterized protein LOC143884900 n=1 Tax=Tasmannia lanceolata TaxID=3420 RepID=UPI0040634D4F